MKPAENRARRIAFGIWAALGVHLLPACAVLPAPRGTPAVIADPTAESWRELSRVIHEALADVPVMLADDALTTSNTLSLEHARPRDPEGRLLNGREVTRPETFELFKRGARCVLVQSKTGREWTLRDTRCVAVGITGKAQQGF